jgi:phenylpropionate dioxygenase-like ring-hydroxylating dioxygenase large terminal subunit
MILDGWYVAAWADEVTSAKPLARTICNHPVVLFRQPTGEAAALIDRCCHRAAPLHLGRIVEGGIECGYHGMVFDALGKCVAIPAQDFIPAAAKVRSFPVVEKNKMIWIWTGEAAEADPSLVPDYPFHDDEANWSVRRSTYKIAANYMLSLDNLMDLTHIGYVHKKTIGSGSPTKHLSAEMNLTIGARGVRFIRWLLNSEPPASYVKACGFTTNVDRWQEFEFIAPGCVVHFAGGQEVGKRAFEDDRRDGGFRLRRFHGFTPETDHMTHYFSSVGNGHKPGDPDATELLFREIDTTLREDIAVVEAQQIELSRSGEAGLITIKSDQARVAMRHVVSRLMAEKESRVSA